jgi:hypothetical protein
LEHVIRMDETTQAEKVKGRSLTLLTADVGAVIVKLVVWSERLQESAYESFPTLGWFLTGFFHDSYQ